MFATDTIESTNPSIWGVGGLANQNLYLICSV